MPFENHFRVRAFHFRVQAFQSNRKMKPATFLFALSSTALAAELTRSDGPAPLLGPSVGASVVPNEYMVVFRDVVSIDVAQAAAKIATGGSDYTYYSLINGFSATLTESALNNLRNRADVRPASPPFLLPLRTVANFLSYSHRSTLSKK